MKGSVRSGRRRGRHGGREVTRTVVTGASGLLGGAVLRELGRARAGRTTCRRCPTARRCAASTCARRRGGRRCARPGPSSSSTARRSPTSTPARRPGRRARPERRGAGRLAAPARRARRALRPHLDRRGLRRRARRPPRRGRAAGAGQRLRRVRSSRASRPCSRRTRTRWSCARRCTAGPARAAELLGVDPARAAARRPPDAVRATCVFSPLVVSRPGRADPAALAERDASGVLNVGASDAVTKEEFGRIVAREFGLPEDADRAACRWPRPRAAAARPRNTALDVTRLTHALGAPPTVADGVRALREDGRRGALKGREGRRTGRVGGG